MGLVRANWSFPLCSGGCTFFKLFMYSWDFSTIYIFILSLHLLSPISLHLLSLVICNNNNNNIPSVIGEGWSVRRFYPYFYGIEKLFLTDTRLKNIYFQNNFFLYQLLYQFFNSYLGGKEWRVWAYGKRILWINKSNFVICKMC